MLKVKVVKLLLLPAWWILFFVVALFLPKSFSGKERNFEKRFFTSTSTKFVVPQGPPPPLPRDHSLSQSLSPFSLYLSLAYSISLSLSLLPTLSLYRLEANIDFNHTSSSLQWFFSNSTFCAFSLCRIKAPFFKAFSPSFSSYQPTYVGR